MRERILVWVFMTVTGVAFGAAFAAGCSNITPEFKAQMEATKLFNNKCATCHGLAGNGLGPAAANCNPRPRDYTSKEWQLSVTDEMIEKTIVYGGAAVGKSAVMPSHPDLAEKPLVVEALRKKIRRFAGL